MTGQREAVHAADAPPAVGPYSHAVRAAGLLFCSGQLPLEASGERIVGYTAADQARQCLTNLGAVCAAAGTDLHSAVRLTVYMTDLGEFAALNEVYAEFFGEHPPARAAVQVAALPRGAHVEVDAIVAL